MESIKEVLEKIIVVAPKGQKDFLEFIEKSYRLNLETIESLSFDFSVGLFLRYFEENSVEWDIQNITMDDYVGSLIDVFREFEITISHYS